MTEKTIFEGEGTQTPEASQQQQGNQSPEATPEPTPVVASAPEVPAELVEWVGEGKKYASMADIYKAFPASQEHINNQKAKIEALEAELAKRKAAEDVLKEMQSSSTQQQTDTTKGVQVDQNVLSSMLDKQLEERLAQREQMQVSQANVKAVVDAFTVKYGDNREAAYAQIAKDNGLTIAQMNSMAATSPTVIMNLAGLKSAPSTPGGMTQTKNTMAVGTQKAPEEISARVGTNPTTKDLVAGWKAAGQKLNQTN